MNGEAFAPSEPGSFRIPSKPKDWFSYPVAFTAVGETSTLTGTVNIDAGSDFYMTALTQFSIVDGATAVLTAQSVVIPTVKLLITDTGSNRQLMNAPVPLSLIAGDGNHPHRLIHPRRFTRNSTIQLVLSGIDTDADLTFSHIWVNLEGFRIYG